MLKNSKTQLPVKKISSFLISHFSFLIALLAILLLPEQTYAYDFMWDDSKYVFQGIGSSVSIQLPIYDKDGRDMWVIDGYVYVKAAGKSEQTLLHYKSEGDISGSAKWYSTIPINFATIDRYADGQWYDMQGRKLPRRPQRKGVYIYNGQKTIIE